MERPFLLSVLAAMLIAGCASQQIGPSGMPSGGMPGGGAGMPGGSSGGGGAGMPGGSSGGGAGMPGGSSGGGGVGMPGGGGGAGMPGGGGGAGGGAGGSGGDFPADDSAGGGGSSGGGSSGGGSSGDGSGQSGSGSDDPFASGDGSGQGGDEEFEESLGDFDGEMSREQESIARRGGGPAADSTVAQDSGDGSEAQVGGGNSNGPDGATGIRELGPDSQAVATVQGCNDGDRVARQLCEAATQEKDPFLRAALWNEYNEYKKLVARQ